MIPASPNNERSSADGLHANLACRVGHGGGQLHRVLAKRADDRFLSLTTGLSAGVILYVSFAEIFPKGEVPLAGAGYGDVVAAWFNAAAFSRIFSSSGCSAIWFPRRRICTKRARTRRSRSRFVPKTVRRRVIRTTTS
jgi:hypothetical protein